MKDRAKLIGISLVEAVEIMLDDRFNGRTIVSQRIPPPVASLEPL
jgi:hypothetical protein